MRKWREALGMVGITKQKWKNEKIKLGAGIKDSRVKVET
jgi:hypothetical protein